MIFDRFPLPDQVRARLYPNLSGVISDFSSLSYNTVDGPPQAVTYRAGHTSMCLEELFTPGSEKLRGEIQS